VLKEFKTETMTKNRNSINLTAALKAKGMTKIGLTRYLGCSKQTIFNYMSHATKWSNRHAKMTEEKLNVTIDKNDKIKLNK